MNCLFASNFHDSDCSAPQSGKLVSTVFLQLLHERMVSYTLSLFLLSGPNLAIYFN